MVPEAIRYESRRGGVNSIIGRVPINTKKTAQMPVFHTEGPAIHEAVHRFAHNSLLDICRIGRPKPRRVGERVRVEIVGMCHLHVAVDAIELELISRELVEYQWRGRSHPRWAVHQRSGVSVAGGISRCRARALIEMPERQQAVFVSV